MELEDLAPLRASSLREVFLERFEALILSGRLRPGDRLPPERELAVRLRVSRPVVHEGLLELQTRGLVRIHPRHGTIVEDYRRSGSASLLLALFRFREGSLEEGWLQDALAFREMVECQGVRWAARRRTREDLATLRDLLAEEERTDPARPDLWADLDFRFHHALAMASRNRILPMTLQSFRPAWLHLAEVFYRHPGVLPTVRKGHQDLVEAIARRRPAQAARILAGLLRHGGRLLQSNPSGGFDG